MTDHEGGTLGLGELEAAIMEVVWAGAPTTVRAVLSELRRSPPPGYTTVATVMNRLVEKGVLQRERSGKVDVYRAPMTREHYMRQVAATAVKRLVNECGDVALVQFAAALEHADPARLARLRERLAAPASETPGA
ncbi:MAG TPA: BlaI/MecI/CopY family transcriptional regulator [Chloroflexota bacterium]|nr:BlaI/MecI/CopY family transcriptional regulator [Chloroflexota bacterium]